MRIEMRFNTSTRRTVPAAAATSDFSRCEEKELIGACKTPEWNGNRGEPVPVKQHDFMDKELEKDSMECTMMQNKGWVSVGVDHETASLVTSHRKEVRNHAALAKVGWEPTHFAITLRQTYVQLNGCA